MSWKFVFNSSLAVLGTFGTINECRKVAYDAGYRFFTWNGRVNYILHLGKGHDVTPIEVKDLF